MRKPSLDIYRLILAIFSLILIIVAITVHKRNVSTYFYGDESTYYCMGLSLFYDHDLRYTKEDLVRVQKLGWVNGPTGILLSYDRANDEYYYAKPLAYPLLAVPFIALSPSNGLIIFNALLFGLSLLLLYRFLGERNDSERSFWLLVLFFSGSVYVIYVFWMSPEIFNASFLVIGLYYALRKGAKQKDYAIASALMGMLIYNRLPLFLFYAMIAAILLFRRRFRSLMIFLIVGIASAAFFHGLNASFTGKANPYAGERKRFNDIYPLQTPDVTFDKLGRVWSTDTAQFVFDPSITYNVMLHNLSYFFFGRFTGMILYFFPFAVVLLLFILGKKDLENILLFLTIIASILALIVMIPSNYQGGGGAVGNRYLISFFPAFLFLVRKVRWRGMIIAALFISGIAVFRLNITPFHTSFYPGQHAQDLPFRLFPVELTLTESLPIFGDKKQRVEYCGGHLHLYFLDDYATGREGARDEFWVLGGRRAEVIFNMAYVPNQSPPDILVLKTFNGRNPYNVLEIDSAGNHHIIEFTEPNQQRDVILDLSQPFVFINAYEHIKYVFKFSFHAKNGYVPKFTGGPADGRYLGIRIEPTMDPFITAQAYLWKKQPHKAIKLLERVIQEEDWRVHAFYLLGKTYLEIGEQDKATKYLMETKRIQPGFMDTEKLLEQAGNERIN